MLLSLRWIHMLPIATWPGTAIRYSMSFFCHSQHLPTPPRKGFIPMVSSEKFPEDVVKHIATDLDVTLKTSAASVQTTHWSSSTYLLNYNSWCIIHAGVSLNLSVMNTKKETKVLNYLALECICCTYILELWCSHVSDWGICNGITKNSYENDVNVLSL